MLPVFQCYQIIDIELSAVFIPVIIDTAVLSDYDIPDDPVNFCERQCLVISDLASVPFEYVSGSETFFLKRVFEFTDLVDQLKQIVIIRYE